jgi:hypothetical protein
MHFWKIPDTQRLYSSLLMMVYASVGCWSCVGDIPNRYTSDVVLNQQARVAHQGWYGGFAIPGGPVAEISMAVLDAGAYGGSGDRSIADYWRQAHGGSGGRPMAGDLVVHART